MNNTRPEWFVLETLDPTWGEARALVARLQAILAAVPHEGRTAEAGRALAVLEDIFDDY